LSEYLDSVDLWFTNAGDFSIEAGDLKDTTSEGLRSFIQEITTTAKSSLQDWKLQPGDGAGLDDFIGRPQSPQTSNLIHDRLRVAIVSKNLIGEENLAITVIPIDRETSLIIMRVAAQATPQNRLGQGEVAVIELIYNSTERNVFILSPSSATIYDVD